MTIDVPPQRYAKGEAKRREILAAALTLVADRGYRNSSLQEIADAVGLSKAGVLHYFDSREELLAEVLRERDNHDAATLVEDNEDTVTLFERTVRYNSTVPGLVHLYSRLVVESEDADHPAHDYIRDRYTDTIGSLADSIRARQATGTFAAGIDPLVVARMVTALSDGLQLQWMHNQDLDMSEVFDAAIALLARPEASPGA